MSWQSFYPPGYHFRDIPKGEVGEFSKITEEYLEALDAYEQGNPVMMLTELADLLGAIDRFLEAKHPSITMTDLLRMQGATRRAFNSGRR